MDRIKVTRFKSEIYEWIDYVFRRGPIALQLQNERRNVVVISEEHYTDLLQRQYKRPE